MEVLDTTDKVIDALANKQIPLQEAKDLITKMMVESSAILRVNLSCDQPATRDEREGWNSCRY